MFEVLAGEVQGNAHENISCSIKIMIISFHHSLTHYKVYKIALVIALINFKFTDLFYIPFISKFILIFWEFNQFFLCKIFYYFFGKRAEQIFNILSSLDIFVKILMSLEFITPDWLVTSQTLNLSMAVCFFIGWGTFSSAKISDFLLKLKSSIITLDSIKTN